MSLSRWSLTPTWKINETQYFSYSRDEIWFCQKVGNKTFQQNLKYSDGYLLVSGEVVLKSGEKFYLLDLQTNTPSKVLESKSELIPYWEPRPLPTSCETNLFIWNEPALGSILHHRITLPERAHTFVPSPTSSPYIIHQLSELPVFQSMPKILCSLMAEYADLLPPPLLPHERRILRSEEKIFIHVPIRKPLPPEEQLEIQYALDKIKSMSPDASERRSCVALEKLKIDLNTKLWITKSQCVKAIEAEFPEFAQYDPLLHKKLPPIFFSEQNKREFILMRQVLDQLVLSDPYVEPSLVNGPRP